MPFTYTAEKNLSLEIFYLLAALLFRKSTGPLLVCTLNDHLSHSLEFFEFFGLTFNDLFEVAFLC